MINPRRGFTLIELSIVLLVIGLIAAGVLVGRSIIRQSEIMAATTEVPKYTSAVNQFKEKYLSFPGDMLNATTYWGINPNCAAGTSGTGTQTCNGQGDGKIADFTSANLYERMEMLYMWQHLVNAGFIKGSYSGATTDLTYTYAVTGVNVPASQTQNAGYSMKWLGYQASDGGSPYTQFFAGNYGHILQFGAQDSVNHWNNWLPVLTPEEALALDTKVDDGLPATGNVRTTLKGIFNCVTTTNHDTARYDLTSIKKECFLVFITGY